MTGKPDDENPEWMATDFEKAKPAMELPPEILAAFPNTKRHLRENEKSFGDRKSTIPEQP